MYEARDEAKAIPLMEKRKRGTPAKASKAFVVCLYEYYCFKPSLGISKYIFFRLFINLRQIKHCSKTIFKG
jgi:hypothetical protein